MRSEKRNSFENKRLEKGLEKRTWRKEMTRRHISSLHCDKKIGRKEVRRELRRTVDAVRSGWRVKRRREHTFEFY